MVSVTELKDDVFYGTRDWTHCSYLMGRFSGVQLQTDCGTEGKER